MSDQKNSLGMDQKTASWFAYVLSALSAIILLVTEKEDKTVRTHAWQSLVMGCFFVAIYIVIGILISIISWHAIWLVGLLGWIDAIAGIVWLVITIICILKALQGDIFKVPVIYDKVKNLK